MNRVSTSILSLGFACALAFAQAPAQPAVGGAAAKNAAAPSTRTYRVEQTAKITEVPLDAKTVRFWVSIPDDDRWQDVLDFSVKSAPGTWSLATEPENGNRFLYVEVPNPASATIEVAVEFTVRRQSVFVEIDPKLVGPLTDTHRKLFAKELRKDAPHMSVTAEIQKTADIMCGDEKNIAKAARKLLDYVADYADHYSKDPSKPKCGIGDAGDCMAQKGGCCTDLHSLFIALARAREIPARLQMGYRVLEKNIGKVVDPGYRCWPEYFCPGYGWVPADIVEGDAADGLGRDRWFSGLTERRIWLNEGREFMLKPAQSSGPVNTMIIGHAEIDGKPARVLPEGEKAAQLFRTVRFVELSDGEGKALTSSAQR